MGTNSYVPGGNNNNPGGINYNTGSINSILEGLNNSNPGLQLWGSNAKTNPYNNNPSSKIVLSFNMPNMSTLDTESLNGFLEQCQQQGLDDN